MKFDRLLVVLMILALAARLVIVFVPTFFIEENFLVANSIALDDAFITFKIARNVYSGLGFSFDNVEVTNASPFLWTYLLSLFGFLDSVSFVLFALSLCSFFFVLSGYFLYKTCMTIFRSREIAILTVFLYLFNPFFMLISVNGLETSLFLLFLMLSLYFYVSRIRTSNPKITSLVFFSVLLALMNLTRGDGLYFFLAFLIDYVFIFREAGIKERFRNFLLVLIVFSLIVSPYFLWSYLEFGHFESGNAYYYSTLFAKNFAVNPLSAMSRQVLVFAMTASVMSLMAGSVILSFLGFSVSKVFRKGLVLLSPLVIFSLLEIFQYSFVMPILRLRYILAATIILVIGLGLLLSYVKSRVSRGLLYVSLISLLIVLSYFTAVTWTGYTDLGDSEIRVGLLLNRHVINAASFVENEYPNSRMGVSHIGAFAYFSPHTIISDRNGKISYEATDYNIQGRIDEYFEKRGVEYLAGFFSRENLDKVIDSDVIFSEPVKQRTQLKFSHTFGYYAVVKFRKDYVNLMTL
jgi:4-amino-4-deoxy-L-arabinose transferase-like glycosyltransferase